MPTITKSQLVEENDRLRKALNAAEQEIARLKGTKPQNPNAEQLKAASESAAKVVAYLESIKDVELEPSKVRAIYKRASAVGVHLKKIGWTFNTKSRKFFRIGEGAQARAEQQASLL